MRLKRNQSWHSHQIFLWRTQEYPSLPIDLKQDNMSTIALLEKGKSTSIKTKHISIRHFWLKEQQDLGTVDISYVPTELMGAVHQ